MTEYEKTILNSIASSEYNQLNGSIPRTDEESATFLWVDELAADSGLTMSQIKGVLGSLVKKELIEIDDWDSEDSLVRLTKKGIDGIHDGF